MLSVLIFVVSQIAFSGGANILIFIGFGTASHRIALTPLAEALVEKGHNITFLAQDKPSGENSNITYFVPEKLTKAFKNIWESTENEFNIYDQRASGRGLQTRIPFPWFGFTVCEQLYGDEKFLEWLKATKFDLVIVDALFNECGYSLAHIYKSKMIMYIGSSVFPWVVDEIGIPDESSSIPDTTFLSSQDMSFFQRVGTAIVPVFYRLFRKYYFFPKLTTIIREGLGQEEFPSIEELEKKTNLVLLNTHESLEFPRSLPPHVIPIGGMSWRKMRGTSISKKMEDFIKNGQDGFVYISFGTFIDFSTFPNSTQQTFINTLRGFPNIQFIWKLNEAPENLPENVFIEKWMPQQELLTHPKIRAFITHAGIGGINEAICSSVPLICFPIFAEQDYNVQLVERKGFGIKMEITALTEDAMADALNRILTDDTYRKNAIKMNKLFLDRTMKPVEAAVWWTEFVLRHDDLDHIRPLSIQQSWWVKRQIDVWIFIFTALISITVINLCIFYKVLKKCVKCSGAAKDTKGKQKLK